MSDYVSNQTLDEAVARIAAVDGPVCVFTHCKPDGDAFGSVVAMSTALRVLGQQVHAWFVPPVPAPFSGLRGSDTVRLFDAAEMPADPALLLVLDTGAWSQLGPQRQVIEPRLDRTTIFDHHLSGDVPAKHKLINGDAAACCELVGEVIDRLFASHPREGDTRRAADKPALPANISDEDALTIRDALFTGLAADTGWFRFSNTRPSTHELAAYLLRSGVDHADIYRTIEQSERVEKLQLTIRALDSLKLLGKGHAAMMVLRAEDFEETGAFEEETERLIDIPQQVGSIEVIALISEKTAQGKSPDDPDAGNDNKQRVTRISFRSKPGPGAVNVAELAGQFGGGGHARASGATVEEPIDVVIPRLEVALAAACRGSTSRKK